MKKLIIIALMGIALLVNAQEWLTEGTLHKAVAEDWCIADYDNKRSTSADFIAAAYENGIMSTAIRQDLDALGTKGMEGIKVLAEELVIAIDTAACEGKIAADGFKGQSVPDLAILAMILMGVIEGN